MAKINDIFQANITDYKSMSHMLEMLWQRELITRNQMHATATALAEYLPAHVMVAQRMPKSVTYVHALGKAKIKISNRAKVTIDYNYIQH